MIMTGRDTIAHTLGLQNLSFVDNPDLNIELRLAFSVSLALVARHELPHVDLITSLSLSMFASYISQIFGIFKVTSSSSILQISTEKRGILSWQTKLTGKFLNST